MRVRVVGCSGLFPSASSPASSYVVEARDSENRTWRILIDCGSGALGPLHHFVAPAKLDAVLISSLDFDHCLDLAALYTALCYAPAGPYRVRVHGPQGTLKRLAAICNSADEAKIPRIFEIAEWTDRPTVSVGPVSITPYQVDHRRQVFGLRLDDGESVIAYSGNGDVSSALSSVASDADLFMAEVALGEKRDESGQLHITGLGMSRIAATTGVHRLVLTHLPIWADPRLVLAEAATEYPGPIELAQPGQLYETR